MRMFAAFAVAGITGAAILKIIAALLAPLWAALAAVFAAWLASIGAVLLGWLLVGLKIGGVVLLGALVLMWLKKKARDSEA